jgi:RNA polymerase sigma factor (TIGR02999 family)
MEDCGRVTTLLKAWSDGDESALERIAPLLYAELRRLAGGYLRRERRGHTLQPTELVSEAFVRLIQQDSPGYNSRAHFLAIASRHMRQILVDHARRRQRIKRGGRVAAVGMEISSLAAPAPGVDLIALDECMRSLAEFDPRKARVLEMHFFGGMALEEIATVLDVHVNTVGRDLRIARAWLQSRLGARNPANPQ